MSKIKENLKKFKSEINSVNCRLVAISKTKPTSMIMEAYESGQIDFGENKVQELASKYEELPKNIQWHMVGHLQRNKVKYIAPFVHLIHSVDSLKLLRAINKEGAKNSRKISCLLQVHIAQETTKFGFDENEILEIAELEEIRNMDHICIKGLMGMATFTDDEDQIRREFQTLFKLFETLKQKSLPSQFEIIDLSMGMSNDFKIAMDCGSTMIRVGTAIFGDRNYT